MPYINVRLLLVWYGTQTFTYNGVIYVYMDDLSVMLNTIGCNVNPVFDLCR